MKTRYIVTSCLLIVFISLTVVFFSLSHSWRDTLGERFGEDYAHVALFYPESEKLTFEDINALRVGINAALVEDSHSSEGRLWYDGFISFSNAYVSDIEGAKSFESEKIVAGGDFFKFYEFDFLSGGAFYSDDNFSDRVVIDEKTSFQLYGSSNSVGMPIYVDSREFYVAGVFKPEDTPAWEAQFSDNPVVIVPDSYEDANLYSVYEIVLPNPVDSYAYNTVLGAAGENCAVIDISDRYSLGALFENLKNFPNRSFVVRPIAYPWFENTARATEDALSCVMALWCISALSVVVSCIYIIVRRKK